MLLFKIKKVHTGIGITEAGILRDEVSGEAFAGSHEKGLPYEQPFDPILF